jgi:hypothetical protein
MKRETEKRDVEPRQDERAHDYSSARERAQAIRIQDSMDRRRSPGSPHNCTTNYEVLYR